MSWITSLAQQVANVSKMIEELDRIKKDSTNKVNDKYISLISNLKD